MKIEFFFFRWRSDDTDGGLTIWEFLLNGRRKGRWVRMIRPGNYLINKNKHKLTPPRFLLKKTNRKRKMDDDGITICRQ